MNHIVINRKPMSYPLVVIAVVLMLVILMLVPKSFLGINLAEEPKPAEATPMQIDTANSLLTAGYVRKLDIRFNSRQAGVYWHPKSKECLVAGGWGVTVVDCLSFNIDKDTGVFKQ